MVNYDEKGITPAHKQRYVQLVNELQPVLEDADTIRKTIDLINKAVTLAKQYDFTYREVRVAISDVAWYHRGANILPSSVEVLADKLLDVDLPPTNKLLVYYYVGQRLRFDYKFDKILEVSKKWSHIHDDVMLDAVMAFGLLGTNNPIAEPIVERLLHDPDKLDFSTMETLLHGLWFVATKYPRQMIQLAQMIIDREEATSDIYAYKATAHRFLGEWGTAMDSITTAIQTLDIQDDGLLAEYMLEFEMIRSFQHLSNIPKSVNGQSGIPVSQAITGSNPIAPTNYAPYPTGSTPITSSSPEPQA